MSGVLTTGSSVTCSNNGSVATSSSAKLRVAGNPVLVQSGIASKSISNCAHPIDSNSGANKCFTVLTVAPSTFSMKLTTGGSGAALDTLSGTGSATNPPDTLSAQAGQTKLTAS
jgi:hypothetical protein